jgi:hypothetical protein
VEITSQDAGELTAAAAGIPVLVATGDCGVVQNLAIANNQCGTTSATPDTAAWDDSPWVTAIGGSVPNLNSQGRKVGPDPVWHVAGILSEGAGYSSVFRRPSYQNGVANITGSPMRSVPDITMDASDGTSQAAPLFNGILALATQVNHGNLGPINPLLYKKLGPKGAKAGIADVVKGNNSVVVNGKVGGGEREGHCARVHRREGLRRGHRLGHDQRAQLRARAGRRRTRQPRRCGRPQAGAGSAGRAGAQHHADRDRHPPRRHVVPAGYRLPAQPSGDVQHRRPGHRHLDRQRPRRCHLHDRSVHARAAAREAHCPAFRHGADHDHELHQSQITARANRSGPAGAGRARAV